MSDRRPNPLPQLLLACLAFAACSRPAPVSFEGGERVDLAPLVPAAGALVETPAIDVGTPEDRPHLARGFGPDESAAETTFAWGMGEESDLRFTVVAPRDLKARLRGWSYPFEDGRGQRVGVVLNGRALGDLELGGAPETLAVDLPASALLVGENRLELRYERFFDSGSGRNRRVLAAAWDGFRFEPLAAGAAPAVEGEEGALRLAWQTGLELPLELPDGGAIEWRGVETGGRGAVAIETVAEGVGTPAEGVRVDSGGGRLVLAPAAAPRLLRLRALPAAGTDGAAPGALVRGLELVLPPTVAAGSTKGASGGTDGDSVAPGGSPVPAAAKRPNVLVYLVDTLRADHVGAYGYGKPTTPALDAVARQGIVCAAARAQSSWTRPTVATILTGLHPITHNTMDKLQRLPEEIETLPERLQAAGYRTGYVTTNANVSGKFGFRQGTEMFLYLTDRRGGRPGKADAGRVNEAAIRWLESLEGEAPFFLYLHTVDPHAPYLPDEPYRSRFVPDLDDEGLGLRRSLARLERGQVEASERTMAQLAGLYDAEIAGNDAAFGELVEYLKRAGLWDSTLVLFVADHGEEFLDHGKMEHGRTLYEEQLRVPMVWKLPNGGGAGRRIETPVEQIDVAPTILEAAGIDRPAGLPGRSLWAALATGAPLDERPSVALLDRLSYAYEAVYHRGFKLIRRIDRTVYRERPLEQLFDLGLDPFERLDRERELPVHRALLESKLRALRAALGPTLTPGEAELDPELERTLRALGYIN
ncbi:MAG: sulfatase [Acidobacteria bacterium]|nr:sulfatase [Acidobacteriota bacterium]MCB9377702.1 sulfatase [Holophagales bacterium]